MSRKLPAPQVIFIPPENLITIEALRDLPPKKGRDLQARLCRKRKYRALRGSKQSQAWVVH
jgi:hypothetical protein